MPGFSTAMAAALALCGAPGAAGGEPEPAAGREAEPEDQATWVDDSHALVERGIAELSERLDRFFADERRLDAEPGGRLLWRNELRLPSVHSPTARTAVRADLRLPAAAGWLGKARLVVSGETSPSAAAAPGEDPAVPALSPAFAAERAALELRLGLLRTAGTVADVGSGVRLRLPPEPFVRARLRRRQPLGLGVEARASPALFWTGREGFGVSLGLDVDRPLGARTLLRWANGASLTGVSRGVEWYSEAGALHEFDPGRAALYLAGSAAGTTRPEPRTNLYRLFVRLRRGVYAHWLFAEVEPSLEWPLEELAGPPRPAGLPAPLERWRVFAVTLRLDVRFDSRAAEVVRQEP
ncbi:MAG TPA: hypothetical protein VH880_12140 [Anaeromyxobacteraceae bacterium]|jgi:hypothetical protein